MKVTYQQKLDTIVIHAREIWTNSGNKQATEQEVRTVAEMTYYAGISDLEWLAKTLKELG